MQALYNEYGSRGFIPFAINLWENMETVVKVYARQYSYPFLRDPGTAWQRYRMNGYIPLNYVVDTAGLVVGSMEGFDEYTIRSWIEPYLTGVAEGRRVELAFAGVFPNPAGSSQTVRFNMPGAGKVTLRVYSSSGELVRTLLSGNIAAGTVSVQWDLRRDDGRQVGNGTYFYELSGAVGSTRLKTTVLK
ncbi:MAG: FlgD immunoglobulin-like domain containing protein [candidate division WOR-3 bacterium]